MATYFGTSINESPTIVLPAKEKIEGAQGIALAISDGQLTKPTAGANVIGLSLFTNDETVEAGRYYRTGKGHWKVGCRRRNRSWR